MIRLNAMLVFLNSNFTYIINVCLCTFNFNFKKQIKHLCNISMKRIRFDTLLFFQRYLGVINIYTIFIINPECDQQTFSCKPISFH